MVSVGHVLGLLRQRLRGAIELLVSQSSSWTLGELGEKLQNQVGSGIHCWEYHHTCPHVSWKQPCRIDVICRLDLHSVQVSWLAAATMELQPLMQAIRYRICLDDIAKCRQPAEGSQRWLSWLEWDGEVCQHQ